MAKGEDALRWLPFTGLGLILGAAVFSGVAYFQRSEERLCTICHEMREPAGAFRSSVHGSQSEGIIPSCTDCHGYSALEAGANILKHMAHRYSPQEERKARAILSVRDEGCRRCHRELLSPSMTPQARVDHGLYLKGKGGKCLSCHAEEGLFHRR